VPHALVPELAAGRLQRLELLGRVVALEHRHPLDRLDEQVGGGAVGAVERGEQALEAGAQRGAQCRLLVEPRQLGADQRARVRRLVAVEQRPDLAQRESAPPERDDPVQPATSASGYRR
jgi:hypothetical protein